MKRIKNNDIIILLFSLLVFSLGVGWIYSKTTVPVPKKMPEGPKEIKFKEADIPKEGTDLKLEDILEYIHELGKAIGLEPVIEFLTTRCPKDKITEIVKTFVEKEEYEFTREQKLKIILAIGKHYKDDKKVQKQIFDIIATHKDIEEGEMPLLFLAVKIKAQDVIPDLISWYKGQKRPKVKELVKQTLKYAAKNDYVKALKKLHENGATIDKEYATKLLWILIKSNTGAKSIEFLKSLGADLNSYDPAGKYTVLIQAIKNKNPEIINKLVELGADVKKHSKNTPLEYPLKVARELDLLNIESLLRAKGAQD